MGTPEFEFDRFFEMSLDHLVVAGFDGYFKRLNRAWVATFGWTMEEFLSRPLMDFMHPEDHEATHVARLHLKNGVALDALQNRYRCKDGSYRWLEWKSVAYVDGSLIYAVARDVTAQKAAAEDQRQAQSRLILVERMASLGRLAAGVGHEINNPLAYVLANLQMVGQELREPNPRQPLSHREMEEILADALIGAERVKHIVRRLMTFSGAEPERRKILDVRSAIELALSIAGPEIRQRARITEDYGQTPPVEADEPRLGQVLVNLLINASDALERGKDASNEIRIRTSTDPRGRAQIEVEDTGTGIPEALLTRIFDPFFTTKPVGVGTGLGLSICHTLVTGMGGEISVTSKEGRGTTFRVALPALASRAAELKSA